MDTTLRDGEQTSGVSFAAHEKLSIAQALLDLGVNRLEIASARVSDGEFEAVKRVASWAERTGNIQKLEVLGFVDGDVSLNWIEAAGCRVVNLLCKGSYKHVTEQLRKTPEQHFADIRSVINQAIERGIAVNIYLEDWSNGIKNSPEYVFQAVDSLRDLPIRRFMLPDTLGILNPGNTYEYCKEMVTRYPDLKFDFHAHNDYDLAVANVYSAVRAGIKGLHTTLNGLGERAGNAPLSSVLAVLKDQLGVDTTLREERINYASRLVETFSGVHIPPNKPIIGEHVFTQCAGVHADGDSKTICIAMICCPNVSAVSANMLLARLPVRRISVRTLKHWGSISTRTLCARLPSGLSNWVIKRNGYDGGPSVYHQRCAPSRYDGGPAHPYSELFAVFGTGTETGCHPEDRD